MKAYRFLLLILFFAWFTPKVKAQAPDWQWAINSGQPDPFDYSKRNGLVTDSIDNIYSLGQGISKNDSNGNLIWFKDIPASSIALDAAGNLYLTGTFSGTLQLDSITLTCPNPYVAILTAKLNTFGKALWARMDVVSPHIAPNDGAPVLVNNISTDAAGNSLISGLSWVTATFDTITLERSPQRPLYFIVKFDKDGNVIQARKHEYILEAVAGPQHSYYIRTNKTIQKMAKNGSLLWEKGFSGPDNRGARAHLYNMAIDKSGNCFVLGNMADTLVFGSKVVPPTGYWNMFLVKYDDHGQLQWVRTNQNLYDSTSTGGYSITVNNSGQVYVGGNFSGTISFDSRLPDLHTASGQGFVVKFSAITGMPYWARLTAGNGFANANALAEGLNGELYVAGMFTGQDVNFGSHTLSVAPSGLIQNYYLGKLGASPAGPLEEPQNPGTSPVFQLFPNPANAEVNLNLPDFRNGELQVFNIAGRLIVAAAIPADGKLKIKTQNWAAGLYMLRSMANGKTTTHKLLVIH